MSLDLVGIGLMIGSIVTSQDKEAQALIRSAQQLNNAARYLGSLHADYQQAAGQPTKALGIRQKTSRIFSLGSALLRLSRCWQTPGDVRVLPQLIVNQVAKSRQAKKDQVDTQWQASRESTTGSFRLHEREIEKLVRQMEAGDPQVTIIQKIIWSWTASLQERRNYLLKSIEELKAFIASPEGAQLKAQLAKAYDYLMRCLSCADTVLEILQTGQQVQQMVKPGPEPMPKDWRQKIGG